MSALSCSRERALPVASYRGKRFIDVVVAAVGLILSAPVQAVIAGLIRWRMGAPVLFRQVRPGLHARPFELLKFRTMLTPEQAGGAADDAGRLTPLGAWLRAARVDKLPSLWNVLRGDLSLVGPQPQPDAVAGRGHHGLQAPRTVRPPGPPRGPGGDDRQYAAIPRRRRI